MDRLMAHRLDHSARIARPDDSDSRVELDSPALAVMTDLQTRRAVTVRPEASLALAEVLMRATGVHLLFVVDSSGMFHGLLTSRDLHGERALAAAARERAAHDALLVSQVMTYADQVEAFDLDAVSHTRVRDIVNVLRDHGRQHMLATETRGDGTTIVRGIFSVTQIGRQLGLRIDYNERAQSFAEIEHLIAGG